MLFAKVANCLPAQSLSQHTSSKWVAERVFIEGLAEVSDDATVGPEDLLADGDDEDGDEVSKAVETAVRTWGHSKEHRPDLPRVVIGMAVTREGILVPVWTWS